MAEVNGVQTKATSLGTDEHEPSLAGVVPDISDSFQRYPSQPTSVRRG
jgi:hypothetical protein